MTLIKLQIYLYYYIGHLTWIIGLKHLYIPGAYKLYNWAMCKSSELDKEGLIWGPILPGPEKDDV